MDDEWKDWVEKVDKNTGETYWYNTKTGATEWTSFVDEDGDGWDDRYAPFHEEDWDTHVDPNSGSTYYVNKMTGETQWADFVDSFSTDGTSLKRIVFIVTLLQSTIN